MSDHPAEPLADLSDLLDISDIPPEVQRELFELAARLVADVRTGPDRREAMREEMLAHLETVYDEESQRLGDPCEALKSTLERWGDADALIADLHTSVTPWDRVLYVLSKGKAMWRWLLFGGIVLLLVGLGFVFPQVAYLRTHGHLLGWQVLLLIVGVLTTLGGAGSAVVGLASRLRGA